MVTNWFI